MFSSVIGICAAGSLFAGHIDGSITVVVGLMQHGTVKRSAALAPAG
jgi:hypothetical protein